MGLVVEWAVRTPVRIAVDRLVEVVVARPPLSGCFVICEP